MILVVSLNPALDVTYDVPDADWAGVNRPGEVRNRPGGKGLNVARTLHSLIADVHAIGFIGGLVGQAVQASLAETGVAASFTPIGGQTRRTFTVVDAIAGRVAAFNEPGPAVRPAEYREFCSVYARSVADCSAVVLSGSLPPGVPVASYAALTATASAAGVPAIIDTDGEALLRAAGAGPAVVKPNLAELERVSGMKLSGGPGPDIQAVREAARGLIAAGAQAAVVSLGPWGLLALTGEGTWLAAPAAPVTGNPTGAGDAVVAGLALGLSEGSGWEERLRQATALGAAAVAAPSAGDISLDDYRRELAGVRVDRIGDRP
jgi:tagatose 6-phosphate kinase